jgi:hypothetical protein
MVCPGCDLDSLKGLNDLMQMNPDPSVQRGRRSRIFSGMKRRVFSNPEVPRFPSGNA